MPYEYHDPANIQFGICRGDLHLGDSTIIPVDETVQGLIQQMILATRREMDLDQPHVRLPRYEPSQDYRVGSHAALPLANRLANQLRAFYEMENRPIDGNALAEPQAITAYFAIVHDHEGNKLVAIRRATQFKGVLKAHLIRFVNDSLRAVPDRVFKLDSEFDLLIVDQAIYVHSIPAFEHLAGIDDQLRAAAIENTQELGQLLTEFDFDGMVPFVQGHKRAARLVAALRARDDLEATSATNFRRECGRSGISVNTVDGKLCPDAGHELAFLQMLDRRRYVVSLVAGRRERYEAGSRKSTGVTDRQEGQRPARRRN